MVPGTLPNSQLLFRSEQKAKKCPRALPMKATRALMKSTRPASLSSVSVIMAKDKAREEAFKLGKNLQEASRTLRKAVHQTVLDTMATVTPDGDRQTLADRWGYVARAAAMETKAKHAEAAHPVLGTRLRDLGYKQVYLASVASLLHAPIWEKQRILRPDRVKEIAKDKMAQGKGLPGVITLYQDKAEPERVGIIDGQHRIGALMVMSDGGMWDGAAHNVLVDVFQTDGEQEVCDLFMEINKAQPVKLVDMPGEGAETFIKAMLSEAAEELRGRYPQMFSPSQRCRAPNVNIDNLRDAIYQVGLMLHQVAIPTQLCST
ncbi:unnamed protein product [Chrysoparadoxa australica]